VFLEMSFKKNSDTLVHMIKFAKRSFESEENRT